MADTLFGNHSASLNSPAEFFAAIAPDDNSDLAQTPRAVYVGDGGDLAVRSKDGSDTVFKNVPSGTTLMIRPVRVLFTGTTALNIVGLA